MLAQQGALNFTPPKSDLSIKLLEQIFGTVDGVLFGTGSQILGAMFSIFNTAVLALGGIVLMYILLVSTLNTAQSGEMLGKKWDSMWIPLRSTLSIALLLPKASGYCTIQVFIMWIIVQGAGAGDRVWEAALGYLARGGVLVADPVDPLTKAQKKGKTEDKVKVASAMLNNLVCMAGLQNSLQELRTFVLDQGGEDPGIVPDFLSRVDIVGREATAAATPNIKREVVFPPKDIGNYFEFTGICGKLSWAALNQKKLRKNLATGDQGLVQQAQRARAVGIQEMYNLLAPAARRIADNFHKAPKDPEPLGHWGKTSWVGDPDRPPILYPYA